MELSIEIKIKGFDEILEEINATTSPEALAQANTKASELFAQDISEWYGEKGGEYWSKPGPTHGAGRISSGWWKGLLNWQPSQGRPDGGSVSLDGEKSGLAQKVKGGTITAKKKRALTIPLVPEAHGRRVVDYEREISELFKPKNKDYLAEIRNGKLRPVYLLRKSVYQNPWPNALPSEEWISDAYSTHFFDYLLRN